PQRIAGHELRPARLHAFAKVPDIAGPVPPAVRTPAAPAAAPAAAVWPAAAVDDTPAPHAAQGAAYLERGGHGAARRFSVLRAAVIRGRAAQRARPGTGRQ